MIKGLRHVKSKLLQARLGKLGQRGRNWVLANYTCIGTKIEEELVEKFEYHQQIPHLICGVWPCDEESQGIARDCLKQFDARPHAHSDRISFRMLSPTNLCGRLFRKAAVDGRWHLKLQFDLKAMNLSPTAEQYLEGGHAFANGFSEEARRSEDRTGTVEHESALVAGGVVVERVEHEVLRH